MVERTRSTGFRRSTSGKSWRWRASAGMRLQSVVLLEVDSDLVLELAITGMNGGAHRGFDRLPVTQALHDPGQIAHAPCVADVFRGRKSFGISHGGLVAVEARKFTLQLAERNLMSR